MVGSRLLGAFHLVAGLRSSLFVPANLLRCGRLGHYFGVHTRTAITFVVKGEKE